MRKIARGDRTNRVKAAADSTKIVFAQEQRRQMTHGENLLWHELRDRKLRVKFRRQHPIGDFILDFYCEEARLAVEVDGPHHADQHDYDRLRDETLGRMGIAVLRLSADDVVRNLPTQLARISAALNRKPPISRIPSGSPSPAGLPRERGLGGEEALDMPQIQLALDFANLSQALRVAHEAWDGGVRRLEAGTPLIKSEGLDAVRRLRAEFPDATIVADMKVMDAGRAEVEMAAKAGANVVAVLGAASDATIAECVEAGKRYDAQIMVDLIEVKDPAARAKRAQELGADIVGVHCPIDVQMQGGDPMAALREVAAAVSIPIAVAGGLNSESAPLVIAAGASIAIIGGAIIKAPDAKAASETILAAIASGQSVATDLFKRGGADQLREMFMRTTTANISDAMHHKGWLPGLHGLARGMKCAGPAVTVWAYPGDWSKPVEAIDHAEPGSVLVVDVRNEGPAVWGEGASKSCVTRGLAGVVINGCARDTDEIIALGFPVFSTMIAPQAGDPIGVGMIGVPLKIGETPIRPGDWIIADGDGVVCVPREQAVEIANRAMDVVEREMRDHSEIEGGSTLAKLAELERWEQKRE